ncbi:MAG: TspO/MBR family protein [Desulfonatronovibrio sp.]
MRSFALFLVLVLAASAFGSVFRPGSWYDELVKPALTPPGWIFPPVWITLYVMIAIAGWLAWKRAGTLKHPALLCWGGQLFANALWSWFFFGIESPELAFADIVVLFSMICGFIYYAYPISKSSSILFIPYVLWVFFAAYLNLGIIFLN